VTGGRARPLFAGLVLVVATLEAHLLLNRGALWRDEINTLNVATGESLAAVWRMLEFESAPLLWLLVVRSWSALGLGETDLGLRLLGVLGGASVFLAGWWVARRFEVRWPVAFLLLVALNPDVLRWTHSLRAFGLGAALTLLVFDAMFRLATAPSRARIAWALLVTVLCVHTLYFNPVFVLAICLGAALVCLRRREAGRLGLIVSVGGVAALSLLPYRTTLDAQYLVGGTGWNFELPLQILPVLASQGGFAPWLWLALLGAAAVASHRAWRGGDEALRDRALFAASTAVAGVVLLATFLVVLGYPPQAWYFVGLVVLVGLSLSLLLPSLSEDPRIARAGLVGALLVAVVSLPAGCRSTGTRYTNVDLIAKALERTANPQDLVVVQPWVLGIPFDRYYRGEAPWTLLPPLADHGMHRWDLLGEQIAAPEPLRDVFGQVRATLDAGGRVFVVRLFPALAAGQPPLRLPPKAEGVSEAGLYDLSWANQLDAMLREQASDIQRLRPVSNDPTNRFETAWVQRARRP